MKYRSSLIAMAALALLVACDKQGRGAGDDAAQDLRDTLDAVASDARAAAGNGHADAALKPGQSVQGTVEADVGKGRQSFRSLATRIADNAAEQFDEKMRDGSGGKALDDANRRLEKLGTGHKVDAGQVRDIVASAAGKTINQASVMHIDMANLLQATMEAQAGDGTSLQLSLNFNDASLAFQDASLTYKPGSKSMFDYYEGKDVQVTIERFERNADGSYALAGTFDAKNVPASKLAKELKDKQLASASGRFDYAALPETKMPGR